MATRSWTAEVFVDHEVGVITPVVQAGTLNGAERQIHALYGPVQQIVNLREVRSGGGGGGASSSSGGMVWIVIGLVIIGIFGKDRSADVPQGPVVDPVKPSIERLVDSAAPIAPSAPVAPQPEFKDYPTPPPSYCITENFEPC